MMNRIIVCAVLGALLSTGCASSLSGEGLRLTHPQNRAGLIEGSDERVLVRSDQLSDASADLLYVQDRDGRRLLAVDTVNARVRVYCYEYTDEHGVNWFGFCETAANEQAHEEPIDRAG